MTQWEREKVRIARLNEIAAECVYSVMYKGVTHKRGWPEPSAKPFHIMHGGGLVASFKSLDKLETNLRGRCGC